MDCVTYETDDLGTEALDLTGEAAPAEWRSHPVTQAEDIDGD